MEDGSWLSGLEQLCWAYGYTLMMGKILLYNAGLRDSGKCIGLYGVAAPIECCG